VAQNFPAGFADGRLHHHHHHRLTSSGRRLNMLQLTVQNGAKLLPDVPKGTGGTKAKAKATYVL